jgi:plastocyanin
VTGGPLESVPLLLATLLAAGCGERVDAGEPGRTHAVAIEGFLFSPAELAVSAGDTVVWVNRDLVPHTATARGRGWDSGEVGAGDTARVVMREAGEHDYLCALHPTMKGRVTVR